MAKPRLETCPAPLHVPSRARVVHYCPEIGLAKLFRPLPKTTKGERPGLNVEYQPEGETFSLQFSAKAALGIPEQTLLLVLLELAKEQYAASAQELVLDSSTTGELGLSLWHQLTKGNTRAPDKALRLQTTWHELNRLYGEQVGGSATATRRMQLKRLCEVVVWEVERDRRNTERQSYLVVLLTGDDEHIHIALNARLASALLGSHYRQVSLTERAALSKDVAKAVHAFLSTAVSRGRSLRIGVETLLERFWPGSRAHAPAKTHSSRRGYIVAALKAIDKLAAWSVQWERSDLVQVRRKAQTDGEMTSHIPRKGTSYPRPLTAKCPSKINELESFDVSGIFFSKKRSA